MTYQRLGMFQSDQTYIHTVTPCHALAAISLHQNMTE